MSFSSQNRLQILTDPNEDKMDLSKYTKTLTSGQKAFFMAYIEAIYFTETG